MAFPVLTSQAHALPHERRNSGEITVIVYIVCGKRVSSRSAVTSARDARHVASKYRVLDGESTIETEHYNDLHDYVTRHTITSLGRAMVPLTWRTPPRVEDALTRRYGGPLVIGDGDTAYWEVETPDDNDDE
jgi:hypothetical protein